MEGQVEMLPAWLPPSLSLELHGSMDALLVEAHRCFIEDFDSHEPVICNGKFVDYTRAVKVEYPEGFWHVVSEEFYKKDRNPNLKRCERIVWIRPIIENLNCDDVKLWVGEKQRLYLWCEAADVIIVLQDKGDHYMLITAFSPVYDYKKRKFNRQYAEYKKKQATPLY